MLGSKPDGGKRITTAFSEDRLTLQVVYDKSGMADSNRIKDLCLSSYRPKLKMLYVGLLIVFARDLSRNSI